MPCPKKSIKSGTPFTIQVRYNFVLGVNGQLVDVSKTQSMMMMVNIFVAIVGKAKGREG